ncbi:hypothetical protein GKC29_25235 [Micromonospora sp. WMMC415]|uniref:hypothetical protein n=1 Tax=Micromonospora sp. WMMC415 TaxID=2675222 RepID=UPI0012B4457A|nr:hypothetical protein [Micromonospora sp. WMMC415]QGN49802.1 hypothetical protein GKC29_25235 [Micromonospora sp. WMMC415]
MIRTLLLPAVVLLAVAGCSSGSEPSTAPTSAAPPPTSAAPSPSGAPGVDGYAQRACQKNTEAQGASGDSLDTLAVVANEAQESTVEGIRLAGAMLDERVKLAEAAKGADDEAAMEAHAIAASFDLTTACAKAGLAY